MLCYNYVCQSQKGLWGDISGPSDGHDVPRRGEPATLAKASILPSLEEESDDQMDAAPMRRSTLTPFDESEADLYATPMAGPERRILVLDPALPAASAIVEFDRKAQVAQEAFACFGSMTQRSKFSSFERQFTTPGPTTLDSVNWSKRPWLSGSRAKLSSPAATWSNLGSVAVAGFWSCRLARRIGISWYRFIAGI